MSERAAVYLRRSREEREDGYSLPSQRRKALRAADEGWRVVDVIEDDGESGGDVYRPGWWRVIELARNREIDVVLAAKRDRLFRNRRDRLNVEFELDELGVGLVALNDTGNRFGDAIQDEFAEWELEQITERLQGGIRNMIEGGEIKAGPKPPYGFRFDETGKMLVPHEPEMAVLRRIFREMASGTSAGEMIRRLDANGILSPSGLPRWNKKCLAHFLATELYEPRRVSELAGLISYELLEKLDKEKVYGLWYWNRRKMTKSKEWDGERIVTHYPTKLNPREEWLAVPVDVTGAGLDRAQIERARERAKDRYRKPSNAAGRFWQLRGIAKCGECGAVLSPQTVGRTRADGSKPKNFYYQCRRKFNTGPKTCDHTRSYPAVGMEELIWESTQGLLRHPERLQKAYEEEIERKKRSLLRDPEKETRTLTEQLEKLERRESGYYDLAADGLMSRDALRGKLTEVERQRKESEDGLRCVRNQAQGIEELRRAMLTVFARFEELRSGELRYLNPEGRRKLYGSLDLRAEVCKDGTVTLAGIFPEDISLPDLIGEHLDRSTEPPEPAVGHDVVVASGNSNSRTL